MAFEFANRRYAGFAVLAQQSDQVFRIELTSKHRGSDQINKHHGELAALVGGFDGWSEIWLSNGVLRSGLCLPALTGAQCGNGVEELAAMTESRDAKLLQVLRRQVRQDTVVYFVVAERGLILPKAQAPQPDRDVHDVPRPCIMLQAHHICNRVRRPPVPESNERRCCSPLAVRFWLSSQGSLLCTD
jgi:hypothetical protein